MNFFKVKPTCSVEDNKYDVWTEIKKTKVKTKVSLYFLNCYSISYFGLSSVIYFFNKKLGILFFIISALIGISRIYCGLHWPSDILVGAVVGVFVGWLFVRLLKKASV